MKSKSGDEEDEEESLRMEDFIKNRWDKDFILHLGILHGIL